MNAPDAATSLAPPPSIPAAVRDIVDTLAHHGFEAVLVGGCVRDLLRGVPVHDFDVATAAPAARVLEIFPRAVPTGLRHGTVMIPDAAGPVDVTSYRAGPRLEDDLAHRDFTVNAMALDPRSGRLVDPFGGRADLAARRLRAVGSAAARFAEDPLRALRGARLVATLGFEPEPALAPAMTAVRAALRAVARERVRHELAELLLGAHAAAGLELLRASGLEAEIAPGAAADAPALLPALPRDLALRLAAWLRGARAASVLPRLRFPRRVVEHVTLLLRLHPVDAGLDPTSDSAVRRLAKRAGEAALDELLQLREAELRLGAGAGSEAARAQLARLAALRATVARLRRAGTLALQRQALALGGREVMEILGCGPSPLVGEALHHLADRVLEDPTLNAPERLADLVRAWQAKRSPRGAQRAAQPASEGEA